MARAELAQSLEELDSLLRDAQVIGPVLELGSAGPCVAGGGAEVLAAQVKEELQVFRAQRKAEYDLFNKRHARHVAELQASRQEQAACRETLRRALRSHLLGCVASGLPRFIADQGPSGEPDVGQPLELAAAAAVLAQALEQKRLRAGERLAELRSSVPDRELQIDVDASFARRQQALERQFKHQLGLLQSLQATLGDRREALAELRSAFRSGPPELPEASWHALWPTGERGGEDLGKSSAEALLLKHGEARVEELCEDFRRAYLSAGPNGMQGELEVWRLRAKLSLAGELQELAEAPRTEALGRLEASSRRVEEGAAESGRGAVAAREALLRGRGEAFAAHLDAVEAATAQHCRRDLSALAAQRRRVELCAAKRCTDLRTQLTPAHTGAMAQIAEAARRLVAELAADGDFELGGSPAAELTELFDRCGAPATERLTFAADLVEDLGPTALRFALRIVTMELQRLLGQLEPAAQAPEHCAT